ncbi:MAG TPA: nucleotidyltransferase domain-containing protein [Longimicrobiaceae bacterium]|nr:nucleotidyltransferase domain-containing protein [Longimicrobiaceae bacterium]
MRSWAVTRPRTVREALTPVQYAAAMELISRVRGAVRAELVQASLFGSRSRGEAGPHSDVDVLLVFRALPPDREPHASHAEAIAEEVARESGVPVTVWSVSLIDLALGNRTPMLVDALEDSMPLWCCGAALPVLPFTPPDALRCVRALLERIDEGAEEFAGHQWRGEWGAATKRLRDDVVRLCTAALLLQGITRPRRGDAARACACLDARTLARWPAARRVLAWAAGSYGESGKEEDAAVPPPPGGLAQAANVVETLRRLVEHRMAWLQTRLAA